MVGFSLVQNIKIVLDQIGVAYSTVLTVCSFSPSHALQTYSTWLPFTCAERHNCSGPDKCYRQTIHAERYAVCPLHALQTYRTLLPFTGTKHQDCSGPDGCYRPAMRAESYAVFVLSMDCRPIKLGCLVSLVQNIMIVLDQIDVIGRRCVQKAIKF